TYDIGDQLVAECLRRNIAARHCFKPMSRQAEWFNAKAYQTNAFRLSQEVIYLPVQEDMGHDDVEFVANTFLHICHTLNLV
ncbi:DegT/DnrJ/EryC1/StrS family aminotransferase, partial [Staphylococcus aureus]